MASLRLWPRTWLLLVGATAVTIHQEIASLHALIPANIRAYCGVNILQGCKARSWLTRTQTVPFLILTAVEIKFPRHRTESYSEAGRDGSTIFLSRSVFLLNKSHLQSRNAESIVMVSHYACHRVSITRCSTTKFLNASSTKGYWIITETERVTRRM